MISHLLALTLLAPLQVPPEPAPLVMDTVPLVPLWERNHGLPPMRWSVALSESARQEATDRQVPIILWVLRDKDPASEAWASQKILDKKYIETLEQETVPAVAWLPALDGSKHTEERVRNDIDAEPHIRCPRLRSCRCKQHIDNEDLLKGFDIPDLLPAAFVVDPDAESLRQLAPELPFQDVDKLKLHFEASRNPERATRLHLEFMEIHLQRAEKYFAEAEYAKGSRELVAAKRNLHRFGPRLHARWDEVCKPYLGYGKRMLYRAKQMGRIDPTRRIQLLRSITEELSGLPPGDTALALLRRDLRLPRKD